MNDVTVSEVKRVLRATKWHGAVMRPTDKMFYRLRLLKAIQRHAPVARSKLPALTGLSAGLITKLTTEMLARGLIVERKESEKRQGRPRVNLEIDPDGGVVVGAMVGDDGNVTIRFIDLTGHIRDTCVIPLRAPKSLGELSQQISVGLHEAIARCGVGHADIRHIAVVVPGIVDARRGIVHFVTTLPPGPSPFAEDLFNALGRPVSVEGDMACLVRAEHWFGRMRDIANFTVIYAWHKLGSARCLDGLPVTGNNGISGEITHSKVGWGPHSPPCFCGSKGCVNAYASIYGICKQAGGFRGVPIPSSTDLDQFFDKILDDAGNGASEAQALLERAGRKLGLAVANHINVTDPGNVLILMPNARALAFTEKFFMEELKNSIIPAMLDLTRIEFDVALPDWRWLGTAALALEREYLS